MTDQPEHPPWRDGNDTKAEAGSKSAKCELARLPGLVAIALYMLLLAGTVILGVALKNYPPLYLFFPALFIAAGLGLLMLFRWAWALALATIVLVMALSLYQFSQTHAASTFVQGLLNLVFFLYLVRAEVRARLR